MTDRTLPAKERGYAAIGLHMPKTPANIGSVLRAAGCYGAGLVAVSGNRYRRAGTDTQAAYRHIPLIHADDLHSVVPFDCVPVAVDLIDGAIPFLRSMMGLRSASGTTGSRAASPATRLPMMTCQRSLAECCGASRQSRLPRSRENMAKNTNRCL